MQYAVKARGIVVDGKMFQTGGRSSDGEDPKLGYWIADNDM